MDEFLKTSGRKFPAFEYKGPLVSVKQMKDIDRLMTEKYKINLLQMMENAGRSLAILAMSAFEISGNLKNARVSVFAGSGGNGGGALAAARRLHNWGVRVEIIFAGTEEHMSKEVRRQLDALGVIGVKIMDAKAFVQGDCQKDFLAIDGLIGYGLKGAPHGVVAELIRQMNACFDKVISLDVPSGMDPDRGIAPGPVVMAGATLTLALPKTGLCTDHARSYAGAIYLADIGVPPRLYLEPELGFKVPDLFTKGDIVHLKRP